MLPERCSIRVDGRRCELAPSYVVSVSSIDAEYLVAVVCVGHKSMLVERLAEMQERGRVPEGTVNLQPVRTVATECVMNIKGDCMDLEI